MTKIVHSLTSTLVATATAFTLLFMAQPAQAFDAEKCFKGAVEGSVAGGLAASGMKATQAGINAIKQAIKIGSSANPVSFLATTVGFAVADCLKEGGLVDDVVNGAVAAGEAIGKFFAEHFASIAKLDPHFMYGLR